jgi:cyclopropane-fatty-acyl-phospholipid synthase
MADGQQLLPFGLNFLINNLFTSRISNSIMNALGNISAHYDLGNDMFTAFLDETLMYSCPIWADADEPLETAQLRKIHAILDRANVQPGQHILEIGTGWGTLAIEAVTKYQCTVTSITLSKEQQILAQERVEKAGLSDKITILLQDYRAMDPADKFDHIVSVEMLEAVGPEYLSTFFQCCNGLLKPNGNLSVQVFLIN